MLSQRLLGSLVTGVIVLLMFLRPMRIVLVVLFGSMQQIFANVKPPEIHLYGRNSTEEE